MEFSGFHFSGNETNKNYEAGSRPFWQKFSALSALPWNISVFSATFVYVLVYAAKINENNKSFEARARPKSCRRPDIGSNFESRAPATSS